MLKRKNIKPDEKEGEFFQTFEAITVFNTLWLTFLSAKIAVGNEKSVEEMNENAILERIEQLNENTNIINMVLKNNMSKTSQEIEILNRDLAFQKMKIEKLEKEIEMLIKK